MARKRRPLRRLAEAVLRALISTSARHGLDQYLARIVSDKQAFGLNVYPASDFYSPLPVRSQLRATMHRWYKPSEMVGVDYSLDGFRELLETLVDKHSNEWSQYDYEADTRSNFGPGFTEIDAMVLYMMVRERKPRRYIECGSGLSTYYASEAAKRNREDGSPQSLSCIDPYPFEALGKVPDLEILAKEVQDVDLSTFEQLEAGDFLVVDTSHIVRVDGDVPYLLLEVFPRLRPGVIIHVHDIPFPYNVPYPAKPYIFRRTWPWYFTEAMLLQAFLTYNNSFETILSVPLLRHFDQSFLREHVPGYERIDSGSKFPPCSIWIERTG